MNRRGRKRRSSCVDDEVCSNSVRGKRKNLNKLLTRPASLEIRRLNQELENLAFRGASRFDRRQQFILFLWLSTYLRTNL